MKIILALLVVLLAGCASTFDTEEQYIRELEAEAYANREYDKPNVQMVYRFVDNPDKICREMGTNAYTTWDVKACAAIALTPCVIILPYAPLKRWVREEQLHCRFGNFHRKKAD